MLRTESCRRSPTGNSAPVAPKNREKKSRGRKNRVALGDAEGKVKGDRRRDEGEPPSAEKVKIANQEESVCSQRFVHPPVYKAREIRVIERVGGNLGIFNLKVTWMHGGGSRGGNNIPWDAGRAARVGQDRHATKKENRDEIIYFLFE